MSGDVRPVAADVAAADLGEVADQLRAVLAAVEAGELACTAVTRRRIEGAVLALDVLRNVSFVALQS